MIKLLKSTESPLLNAFLGKKVKAVMYDNSTFEGILEKSNWIEGYYKVGGLHFASSAYRTIEQIN